MLQTELPTLIIFGHLLFSQILFLDKENIVWHNTNLYGPAKRENAEENVNSELVCLQNNREHKTRKTHQGENEMGLKKKKI